MMFVLALETPNGAITTFTSSVPWAAGASLVVINGRTRTEGWTELSTTQVQLAEAPRVGDVVGFLVG